MKLLRPLVALSVLVILICAALLWWNYPTKADMSKYVPADSLVFIELNSLPELNNSITQGDAWKALTSVVGGNTQAQGKFSTVTARAGIGPAASVVFNRAQLALVVLGVDASENETSLRVKPDIALVVETHTAKWRVKPVALSVMSSLGKYAYGDSSCTETEKDVWTVECVEPNGPRKLFAVVDGSVLIIGNSQKAVSSCLEVKLGQRPSLSTDTELSRSRERLKANSALAYGYISQRNAARLFSLATPLLMGKAPGDSQLEKLLGDSAEKILRSVAWTTTPIAGQIEDRFEILLDPEVLKKLEPVFNVSKRSSDELSRVIPSSFRSMTIYRSESPVQAWNSLNTAVAMRLDAVSSVLFSSLIRSGLSTYGIENPSEILPHLSDPLVTLRPVLGEGSLLLARIKNEEAVKSYLSGSFMREGKSQVLPDIRAELNREKEFSAFVHDGFVVFGKTDNIRVYLDQLKNNELIDAERMKSIALSSRSDAAGVVTYTNERQSLTEIVSSVSRFRGRSLSNAELELVEKSLNSIPLSWTESSLNNFGIERKSRSALGLFGSLFSFAQTDSRAER